ncbi:hypothetical protein SDC9_110695 [bioreactor metagenome]|uniref:Uncharacterized protein n=1 Tax=bioreactor metagenome TaxID=1076179 RepID=A0A645BGX9_9ZZZZ
MLVRRVHQACENGIRDVADARLQRPQGRGHPVRLDLHVEEVEQMGRDRAGVIVQRLERRVAVGVVGLDDGDDLARINPEGRTPDDVTGVIDRDRLAASLDVHAVVDVVQAVEIIGLPGVDLDDDLVSDIEVGAVVADGGARDDVALLGDGRGLDHREVQRAEEAHVDELLEVRQVDVAVVGRTVVDLGPQVRVGLVRGAESHATGVCEHTVQLGRRRGARERLDGEVLAA